MLFLKVSQCHFYELVLLECIFLSLPICLLNFRGRIVAKQPFGFGLDRGHSLLLGFLGFGEAPGVLLVAEEECAESILIIGEYLDCMLGNSFRVVTLQVLVGRVEANFNQLGGELSVLETKPQKSLNILADIACNVRHLKQSFGSEIGLVKHFVQFATRFHLL